MARVVHRPPSGRVGSTNVAAVADPDFQRAVLDAAPGPMHPAARETFLAALDAGWADPRRLHSEGRRAAALLDTARSVLAAGLDARPDEVTLHPTGSHALLAGLRGIRLARRRVGATIVTTAVDQALVLREPDVDAVGVDSEGRLDLVALRERLAAPHVALCVLAAANQEIGTRQPIADALAASAAAGVPLLVDLAASWGRSPLPPRPDAYAADASSVGGPPLGVLAVRPGTRVKRQPVSTPERGLEPAPPFVPLALAAAEAWRHQEADREVEDRATSALIDRIRAAAAALPDVQVVGSATDRLPHVATFSVLYVDGETLVHELDRRGFAVASGSACTADTLEPSHVLAAIGAVTHGNVRITLPTSAVAPHRAQDVDRFCTVLPDAVSTVRAQLGTDRL